MKSIAETLSFIRGRIALSEVDLYRGKYRYTCHALSDMIGSGLTKSEAFACTEYLRGRLYGSATLEAWLVTNGYIASLDDIDSMFETLQAYRVTWIDHLIKELS